MRRCTGCGKEFGLAERIKALKRPLNELRCSGCGKSFKLDKRIYSLVNLASCFLGATSALYVFHMIPDNVDILIRIGSIFIMTYLVADICSFIAMYFFKYNEVVES